MGKKRIISGIEGGDSNGKQPANVAVSKKTSKKQILKGSIHVFSSYNNTIVSVTDPEGNLFAYSSAGMMGFKGARKSTPFAATIVGKEAAEKAKRLGLQEAKVLIKGIGPGREAAIRGIASTGINVISITDNTPVAHNGVRAAKPRRV